LTEFLCKITGLEPEQLKPAFLASLYIFCVLAGYYVVQPLRDDIGLLLGEDFLPKLFIWTLVVMALANPLFSYLLNRFSRILFIKYVYRFFSLNIVGFIVLFKYLESLGQMPEGGKAVVVSGFAFAVGVAFFLWVSVFNLFAVSIFWALMADLYDSRQSKKLFGLLGAGGTLGQLFGSAITKVLVVYLGPTNLLFVTVALLEVAVFAMTRLTKNYRERKREPNELKPNAFSGVSDILKSPFLIGICFYLFLYTFTSTFLYFQKQSIVAETLAAREARVGFFASINLWVGCLTLIIQLFLTGRLIPLFGIAAGLSMVPVVTAVGFLVLAYQPGLMPLAVVEICRKTANYGISRPSREMLYTVVSRREKYLSKSFIDTFVYRAGDAVASGAFQFVTSITSSFQTVSLIAVPIAVVYFVVSLYLGRAHSLKAAAET
jgi:AAA family ATP:ADP antiporter